MTTKIIQGRMEKLVYLPYLDHVSILDFINWFASYLAQVPDWQLMAKQKLDRAL